MADLGDRAKDKVTGYTGIVVAKTHWLNGCVRVNIQSEALKDGKPLDAEGFDSEQVEVIAKGVHPVKPPREGPMPDEKSSKPKV